MRNLKLFCCIISLLPFVMENLKAQSVDVFNTLTIFYLDNSEGYNTDTLNSALNNEVIDEFKNKLTSFKSKPDNYFMLLACNGEEPEKKTNIESILDSDWLRKYFGRASRNAEYGPEKQSIRENFVGYSSLRIKKEVDVYLFLSSYALNQVLQRSDELPTPVFLPKEIMIYLNNKDLYVNLNIYTNKEVVYKLTPGKIKSYFNFCSTQINQQNIDVELFPF